jgi:hypothetical protein
MTDTKKQSSEHMTAIPIVATVLGSIPSTQWNLRGGRSNKVQT